MIVNKEQLDTVLTDPVTGQTYPGKELVVSYVGKEGNIQFLRYPIPKEQMFIWKYSNKQYADKEWRSFDNKWVKKVMKDSLNEYRMNEILCSFGSQVDPLFENNIPETWFCDIETNVEDEFPDAERADQPVNTIALTKFPKTIVWGRKPLSDDDIEYIKKKFLSHENEYVRKYKFEYRFFENEADMLFDFFKFIQPIPAITGWNFLAYDWIYLYNRAVKKLGMDISWISPTGHFWNYKVQNKNGSRNCMLPMHKIVYDYLMVYQKWDYSVKVKENFKLDWTAEQVLGYKKVQHSLGFKDFYEQEYPDYVFYNAIDTVLVEQIDKKIKTASIWYSLAAELRTELMVQFSTVKPTEVVMVNFCYPDKQVIPQKDNEASGGDYPGAFVWPSQPGIYKMIGGLDFASLYPTTQRMFNISPETFKFVDTSGKYIPAANEIKCSSGAVFDKSYKGLMPRILTKYFMARKESKKIRKNIDGEVEILEEILNARLEKAKVKP